MSKDYFFMDFPSCPNPDSHVGISKLEQNGHVVYQGDMFFFVENSSQADKLSLKAKQVKGNF